jgi:methyl-accepting chemotaxis protein
MIVMARQVSVSLGAVAIVSLLLASSAGGVGTCREAGCGGGRSAPPKPKCDEAALARAQQEFDSRMEEYKAKSQEADANWDKSYALYEKASKLFEEEMGLSELSTTGTELTLHHILDEVIEHHGGHALAEEFGSFATSVSLALFCYKMGAMMREMQALGKESDEAAREAEKVSDEGYEALKAARAAHERLEQLKKQCQGSSGSGSGSPGNRNREQDQWRSAAQKEAEAARQILSGWKRVAGGYEDMNGDFHDADEAFQEALQIVQAATGGTSSRLSLVRPVSFGSPLVAANEKLPSDVRRKFASKLTRALDRFAAGGKRFLKIRPQLDAIQQAQGRLAFTGSSSR